MKVEATEEIELRYAERMQVLKLSLEPLYTTLPGISLSHTSEFSPVLTCLKDADVP